MYENGSDKLERHSEKSKGFETNNWELKFNKYNWQKTIKLGRLYTKT